MLALLLCIIYLIFSLITSVFASLPIRVGITPEAFTDKNIVISPESNILLSPNHTVNSYSSVGN